MRTQLGAGRTDETVRMIHQIEHWRNHKRARDYTDDERDLLLPRRGINELTGLKILKVVVRDCGNVENHCGRKKRECHQRFARVRRHIRFYAEHKQQRSANYYQNSDA